MRHSPSETQKAMILQAWERREPFANIAMRYRLTTQQVREIVNEHARQSTLKCLTPKQAENRVPLRRNTQHWA